MLEESYKAESREKLTAIQLNNFYKLDEDERRMLIEALRYTAYGPNAILNDEEAGGGMDTLKGLFNDSG